MKEEIKLCNGFTAFYSEDVGAYECDLNIGGNEVLVSLVCNPRDDDSIERTLGTFEEFWNDREEWIRIYRNTIGNVLLPYLTNQPIYKEEAVTTKQFESSFPLTAITLLEDDGYCLVQLSFSDTTDVTTELCMSRELDNDGVSFYFNGTLIEMDDDEEEVEF